MYCVYIIKSLANGQYYIGCTNDIERRLTEHNRGQAKFTRNRGPWQLIHKEEFSNLSRARRRE